MIKKNVFITGATGMLASYFYNNLKKNYNPIFLHHRKVSVKLKYIHLNYLSKKDLKEKISKFLPKIFIHTAGITSVEKCERNKKKTIKVNFQITRNIADICKILKINLVYISSDHLFDGKKYNGYTELSKTKPLNLYAKTKLMSENYIKKKLKKYLIIRTNFFGKGNEFKKSFSDRIIYSLKNKKKIKLFQDVYSNPISMNELVNVIIKLIKKKKNGLFNVCTDDAVSKFEFGLLIAKYLNLDSKFIKNENIDNVKLVKRPKSMFLKNNKIKKYIKFKSKINQNLEYI